MIALIDGDIVAYRCAVSTILEGEAKVPAPFGIIKARANEMLHGIFAGVNTQEYKIWVSGDSNFRYDLFPQYKANRKAPKPVHLEDLKEYLVTDWGARVADGIEADDALAIDAEALPECVICSIDKDMKQVPGFHYNFVKGSLEWVTVQQGMVNFYRQMLIGDSSDNVKGVDGIGPVKAARHIPDDIWWRTAFDVVRKLFNDDERFLLTGDLLHLQRYEGHRWSNDAKVWITHANSRQEQEATSVNSESGLMERSLASSTPLTKTDDPSPNPTSGTPTEVSSPATSDQQT